VNLNGWLSEVAATYDPSRRSGGSGQQLITNAAELLKM
jgi:hypothetical protein